MIENHTILSVTQLNRRIRSWLENEIEPVSVEGEISNLSRPASGHYYFTLKDSSAQVRCVYFKQRHQSSERLNLDNGQKVILNGTLTLYEARGDYQILVDEIREAGLGNLHQQFELLKAKLMALGWFDITRKKPLPAYPHSIGIITSPTGAALQDMLKTLSARYPCANIVIYPADVQGKLAAPQLISAIQRANQSPCCDVLILSRGGGSIEDLWAFNDEKLAYAITQSKIPIISGIGHETDVTIADFVADLRAHTPTAAAIAATPNRDELIAIIQGLKTQLLVGLHRKMQFNRLIVEHAIQKLSSPDQLIRSYWQSLDYIKVKLKSLVTQQLLNRGHLLSVTQNNLKYQQPLYRLLQSKQILNQLENNLQSNMHNKLILLKQTFRHEISTLHAVSPLATLERGYAVVTHKHKIVMNAATLSVGDNLNIRLANGKIVSRIISLGDTDDR